MPMELSTIIVNWNSCNYLRECLKSMGAKWWADPHETIVVDSGSFDGCESMLRTEFPGVRFIQLGENVGFARANNEGFKASRGDLVLFLNPDVRMIGTSMDTLLLEMKSASNAGCVGCTLLNADSSMQTSCVQAFPTILNQLVDADFLRRLAPDWSLWGTTALYSASRDPRKVEVVSGACVMLRREVFAEAGMFSEDYFMYGEDVDLSHKVLARGYDNYLIPGACMVHYGGGSSQGAKGQFAAVMMREAIWTYFKKTRGRGYARSYRAAMMMAALVRTGMLIILGPALAARGRSDRLRTAWSKWTAVLEWAVLRQRSLVRLQ